MFTRQVRSADLGTARRALDILGRCAIDIIRPTSNLSDNMKKRILFSILAALFFCSMAGQVRAQAGWVRLYAGEQAKEGRVFAISANTYMIDIGISQGACVGEYYLVYYDGAPVHDTNGVPIGVYKVPVAVLRVRETATSESFCEVASPSKGWVIQQGDGVVWIAASDANKLKFATFRSTPDRPYLPGYTGRWSRVLTGTDPVSVVGKYNTHWTLPGFPQGMPPASPGFYYADSPMPEVPPVPWGPVRHVPPQVPVYQPPAPPPHYQPFLPACDFDVNQIYDARLIRTFPLTRVEMYALEIQHRGAWDLYSKKRYLEAFSSFSRQSLDYAGNYLSAYWAGVSALKLGDKQAAISWFNRVLEINPYHQPAIKELSAIR